MKKRKNELHVKILWCILLLLGICLRPTDWLLTILYLLLIINILDTISCLCKKSKNLKQSIRKPFLILFSLTIISLLISLTSILWLTQPEGTEFYLTHTNRYKRIRTNPQYKINFMIISIISSTIMLIIYAISTMTKYKQDALRFQENIIRGIKNENNN